MPEQDLTIYTRRPEREQHCPACQFSSRTRWLDDDDAIPEELPAHTCRARPATPRDAIAADQHAAAQVHLERELRIRRERIADLFAKRG
jgi:hypothetical protein